MIAVSWILTLLLVSSELISRIIVQSVPAYRYLLICNQGRCPRNYLRFRPVLVVIAYFITIIVFIITAILLHRSHQFRNSFKPNERKAPVASRRYPTWKLGLNVATFAVFYLFYVVYIVIVMNKRECFLLEHMPKIRTIFAFIRLGLVVRIFVDQVVSMVTDQQVRAKVAEILGLSNATLTSSSQRTVSTVISDPSTPENTNNEIVRRNTTPERQYCDEIPLHENLTRKHKSTA
ncbi:hypothetical protein AB6A40_005119 [Gnathostoma spinigerum]|uniref:G-protein coupled receptors family 1 profile domain-containing protein n=1 Tax=Gnathostoma spinigerum TaxID=75299 RepID=A0ABD6EEH9_9BILA